MDCECNKKVQETITRKISEAKKVQYEQQKHLELFQKGIHEGAIITISKMIYKMSIYSTSKIYECQRNISDEQIQNVLDQHISKIPELSTFYANNRMEILRHKESFDVRQELRALTKKKEGAAGRLEKRKNDDNATAICQRVNTDHRPVCVLKHHGVLGKSIGRVQHGQPTQ